MTTQAQKLQDDEPLLSRLDPKVERIARILAREIGPGELEAAPAWARDVQERPEATQTDYIEAAESIIWAWEADARAMNPSGIIPTRFNLLIEPEEPKEKSEGGVYFVPATIEKAEFAGTKGKIIAISPLAFNYVTAAEWEAAKARKPQVGDTALFEKFAGIRTKGRDGKDYVLLKDEDVVATVEE